MSAWTCSKKRSSPPGRSTRESSARARAWSGHRAQHQGGDRSVHAGVSGREGVGGAIDHLDRDQGQVVGGLGEGTQIRLGLHGQDLGDRWRVVGEVEAVAGADLEHPAGQAGEEGAPVLEGALGVHGRADAGVDASEDRVAFAGGWRDGHACSCVELAGLPPGTILPLVQVVN
jgi:hypothetical protein